MGRRDKRRARGGRGREEGERGGLEEGGGEEEGGKGEKEERRKRETEGRSWIDWGKEDGRKGEKKPTSLYEVMILSQASAALISRFLEVVYVCVLSLTVPPPSLE